MGLGRGILFVLLLAVFTRTAAGQTRTDWVGPPGQAGDWFSLANWSSGLPNTASGSPQKPYGYIDNGGIAEIDSGQVYTLGYFTVGNDYSGFVHQTGGTVTISDLELAADKSSVGGYTIDGGNLITTTFDVGCLGSGSVHQSGGAVSSSLCEIGKGDDYCKVASGEYYLTGGTFSTPRLYVGNSGSGTFVQSGGTATVDTLYVGPLGSRVELSGNGQLNTKYVQIGWGDGAASQYNFRQSGGLHTSQMLAVASDGNYTMSGGTLAVANARVDGIFDFSNLPSTFTLASGGVANFSRANLVNTAAASIATGPGSLLILPKGFNAAAGFGNLNAQGLVHVTGNDLLIPAGTAFGLIGNIDDMVICEGTISYDPNGTFSPHYEGLALNRGIQVRPGGVVSMNVNFAALYVEGPDSSISGGTLSIQTEKIAHSGDATFTQTGGMHHSDGGIVVGEGAGYKGTYRMQGGTLDAYKLTVGSAGEADFLHSGGFVKAESLVVTGDKSSSYQISTGATLQATKLSIGSRQGSVFTQTGGTVNVSNVLMIQDYMCFKGEYDLTGGELTAYGVQVGPYDYGNEPLFRQTGGTHTITKSLILGASNKGRGRYELSGSGALTMQDLIVGNQDGTGRFVQAGGTSNITGTLYAANGVGSTGTVELSAGTLTAAQMMVGNAGNGSVLQSGGSANVSGTLQVKRTGRYELSGSGHLDAGRVTIDSGGGIFSQTGGTASSKQLDGAGAYELAGGTLAVTRLMQYSGTVDLKNSPSVLSVPSGFLQFDAGHNFLNAAQACLSVGDKSLLILPADFDPSSTFGTVANSGLTHIQGQTLDIPAGREILGWGQITGHVACAGRLDGSDGGINMSTGLHLTGDGAYANLGTGALTIQNALSGIDGGELRANSMSIGGANGGSFTQTGGAAYITSAVTLSNGSALIQGGSLTADQLSISGATGTVVQSGASAVTARSLALNAGSYEFQGGAANIATVTIPSGGTFKQTGDSSLLNATTLTLSGGTYQLGSGTAQATTVNVNAGQFLHDGASAVLACSKLNVAGGNLTLRNGSIQAGSVSVSAGTLLQAGGNLQLTSGLSVGAGTYDYTSGSISCQSISVSSGGRFIQRGQTLSPASFAMSGGTYEMIGGELDLPQSTLSGTFINSGGQHTIAGSPSLSGLQYTLSAGSLTTGSVSAGYKQFTQKGGTHTVNGNLTISVRNGYALSGGTLTASSLNVGANSYFDGDFNQTGGLCNVSGTLTIKHNTYTSPSTYALASGQLEVGSASVLGKLSLADSMAEMYVTGQLNLASSAQLTAAAGATIHMVGADFTNMSSSSYGLSRWNDLTMVFEGGQDDVSLFEVAGKDVGALTTGFKNSYAMGTIELGGSNTGYVRLIDGYRNSGTAKEAVYVDQLTIEAGSTLDLNGLNVYYRHFANLGGTVLLNGGTLAEAFIPGDFNQDRAVDDADYTVWADYYYKTPPANYQHGGDASGGYNDADYTNWADNFTGDAGNTSVPEPSTLTILSAGVLAAIRRRRRA